MKQLLVILFLVSFYLPFAQTQNPIIDSLFYGVNGIKSTSPDVGLVIGIYQNNQTHYYSFGTRKVNGTVPVDSATIFEIGSATKTFTSLLLAEAIQAKKVGKGDFVDQYLPKGFQLPILLQHKIRLTDLASHQSGLPNLSNDVYFTELLKKDSGNPFRFVDSAYLYNVLKQTDSLSNYGKYQYNNYAFSLLGSILGNIYRTNYALLLTPKVLNPLGMKYTSLAIPANSNVAGLYSQRGTPQDYLILDAVNPAGGLKSNAVDMMKYLKAHLLINPYSKAIELTRKPFYKDAKRSIGLGWDIEEDYYQKDGDTFGNSTLMRYSPVKQVAVVVLLNHQNGQLARDVVDFIYKRLN